MDNSLKSLLGIKGKNSDYVSNALERRLKSAPLPPFTLTEERSKSPEYANALESLGDYSNNRVSKLLNSVGITPEIEKSFDLPMQAAGMIGSIEDVASKAVKGAKVASSAKEVLDMSKEARMARAREMGFDTNKTWYHGSKANIPEFDVSRLGSNTGSGSAKQGFFFASDPSTAGDYARTAVERSKYTNAVEGAKKELESFETSLFSKYPEYKNASNDVFFGLFGNAANDPKLPPDEAIAKLKSLQKQLENASLTTNSSTYSAELKLSKVRDEIERAIRRKASPNEIDNLRYLEGKAASELDQFYLGANVTPTHLKMKNPYVHDFKGDAFRDTSYSDIMKKAKKLGHDSVIFKNTYDPSDGNNRVLQDIVSVFEPDQIRSVNAKFDPSKAKSSNILAGVAGAGIGLGAYSNDAMKRRLEK